MSKPIPAPIYALAALALCGVTALSAAEPDTKPDRLAQGFQNPPKQAQISAYWVWMNGHLNREHVEQELKAFHDAGIRGVCIFDMGARGDTSAMPPAGPPFMSEESVADIAHAVRVAGKLGIDVQLSVASSWDMGGSWVEPRHASMGLFTAETTVSGPAQVDELLPEPTLPAKAPRDADGKPLFSKTVAVLALPIDKRAPGHDFVFRLDPPGLRTLDRAVLHNALSEDAEKYGPSHLFVKDFSIAVSTTEPTDEAFREVLNGTLEPNAKPQRFDLPAVEARFVRLRLLNGHNPKFDRLQFGELELIDAEGINVVASHVADRSRDGAELLSCTSALGQIGSWTAGNIHDGAKSRPDGCWASPGLPPVLIEDLTSVVDLTDSVDDEGRLQWDAPQGNWIIRHYLCGNTGERLKVPSPNSNGLATDHFSREATREFLRHEVGCLQSQLGDLSKTALKQLYLASYEVRGAIWTPDMLDQFRHYRGYDMKPYLPALAGSIVVNDEVTKRFLYDYRKTLGELLVDAYYREAVNVAHEAGLGIESEAGGPGPPIHQVPVDALSAQGAIDEIRGEFWPHRPAADNLWVVKETACAGHIYGKRRIHMEAFTSMHHWQDGPFDLKPSADRAFCEGMNHVVWHTAAHLPPEVGKPGCVYYAGTHLNANVVWWPKARAFTDYLARCSYLLQQGNFVGDVCYYYGDQGYNFVPPKHIDPSLGPGYDYDVTNREVILTRMSVQNGRITLPDGTSYALLVLPERPDIDLDVLQKIDEFVRAGATVVGPKPMRATGLNDYRQRDRLVRTLADRIWGPCDGKNVFEHQYGRGRVVCGQSLRDVLTKQGTGPDFTFAAAEEVAVDFIHRRTRDADIYFVSNPRDSWQRGTATFRVRERAPERWCPATGRITHEYAYKKTARGIAVPLELEPLGSTFVVFRAGNVTAPPLQLQAPETARTIASAKIRSWDGQRASLTIFEPGRYQLQSTEQREGSTETVTMPKPMEVAGPWTVHFAKGAGAPDSIRLDELTSWTDHDNPGVQHFSGIAKYETTLELPADWLKDGRRVYLDLGSLWAVGEVWLNGKPLGVVWKPPYVLDVTSASHPGKNGLMVEVANTWSNRLVGDSTLPEEERLTQTNVLHNNGKLWKGVPLQPSGLFGPVRLLPAKDVTVVVGDPGNTAP